MVEVPGTISHRGGIIDIYPPTSDSPARLEFFGNTVENIRLFDPTNQRSQTSVSSVPVCPATELLSPLSSDRQGLERVLSSIDLSGCNAEVRQQFEQEMAMLLNGQVPGNMQFYALLFNKESILEYLPRGTLLVIDEPLSIKRAMEDLDAEAVDLSVGKSDRGELPVDYPRPYFTWEELGSGVEKRQHLELRSYSTVILYQKI